MKQKREGRNIKDSGSKQAEEFVSIERKISKRFGSVIMLCCIVLGVVTSVLNYISSVSAISATLNETSAVAAAFLTVTASM